MTFYTRALMSAALVAGVTAAACGGLPTAPSQEGATISGTVAGGAASLSALSVARGAATASTSLYGCTCRQVTLLQRSSAEKAHEPVILSVLIARLVRRLD